MLIVNRTLKYLDGYLEPGTRVPEEVVARLKPHLLQAYKSQGVLFDGTAEEAAAIRKLHLDNQKIQAERMVKKTVARVQAEIVAAQAEVKTAARIARQAEEAHADLVEKRKGAETEAQEKLDAVNRELANLSDFMRLPGPVQPEVIPSAPEPEPAPEPDAQVDADTPSDDDAPALSSGSEPAPLTKSSLGRMNKAQLTEVAGGLGLAVAEDTVKRDIVEAILGTQGEAQ